MNKHIPALTGLRAIAALWVLVFHVFCALQTIPGGLNHSIAWFALSGYLGVDVFFVLSGFVIAHNYAGEALFRSPGHYGGYLWKRFARIYPVHVACMVLLPVVILALQAAHLGFASFAATSPFDTDMSLGSLLKSLLLIHAWAVPAGRYWNVASWSISAEWAAYLCFPFIALIAVRLRSAAAVLFMIALTCATFAAFVHFVRFDDSVGYAIPRVATAFACGVLLQRLHSLRFAATGEALTVVALVVLIFGSVALDKVQHRSASLGYAPIVACVLVYSLACSRGPVARFLSTGAMQYGGRISYALYLVHLPVIFAAATAINRLTFSPSRATVVFGMTAAVLVCWALAHWMYTSIETHARQWLVGLLPSPARRPVLLPLEGRPDSAQ